MTIFAGEVLAVQPAEVEPGQPVTLSVSYMVSTTSTWEAWTGWDTTLTIELDGIMGSVDHNAMYGHSQSITDEMKLGPDVMPNHDISGTATLVCWKGGFSGYNEVVDRQPITIRPVGGGGNGGNGGSGMLLLLLIGGALLLLVILPPGKQDN